MSDTNTINWLKAACIVTGGFGVLIAFGAHPATSGPINFLADFMFWPVDGAEKVITNANRLADAILGGVMVGWAVLLWIVTTQLYPRDPSLASRMITWSMLTWFPIDSAASIAAGAPLNVVGNLVFLAMFLLPLRRQNKPLAAATQ